MYSPNAILIHVDDNMSWTFFFSMSIFSMRLCAHIFHIKSNTASLSQARSSLRLLFQLLSQDWADSSFAFVFYILQLATTLNLSWAGFNVLYAWQLATTAINLSWARPSLYLLRLTASHHHKRGHVNDQARLYWSMFALPAPNMSARYV